ncbi:hypothetical protein [Neobacillus niacini]|uniref:hypothetical protein n=1 Tax=Neobacillus niacini TaxID=86668 RepID=UPI0021CB83A0|nr:hypothetical protein [Neobacillus niacini]MCM3767159.1 hypothetical protein [Neobacillus niacini]
MKRVNAIFILLITAIFLAACSGPSFSEESKTTIKTVSTTFQEKAKQPNKKSGDIHFYIPFGYEIDETAPNNIILKNGSKTYILFVNPQEKAASEVVYKSTVEQYEKLEVNEKFTGSQELGFLTIKQLEDNLNEVTVGIGGVKLTSQVKTSNLDSEAKVMMQIVKSVQQ